MFFEKHVLPDQFKRWIWNNRENRAIIFFAFIAILIQYFVFNRLYPFPNFLPDSYSYLDTAHNNLRINMWPVGYSNFLRFISVFNYTDDFLFFVQYTLLQSSIMFFVFTVCYFFDANKWVIRIIIFLSVINPFWLYVSNFVSSDALFASFSLLWLTTLFWIMFSPGRKLVLVHGLILFYVFSIRYNALYYPIISVLVICFLQVQKKEKLLLLLFTSIPVLFFIGNTTYQYQRKTKTAQFSPFGGWQLAANAMYMYAHVSPKTEKPVPKEFEKLHAITVRHMDSLNHVKPKNRPDNELGIYYLWNDNSPLKLYFVQNAKTSKDSSLPYLNQWAKLSPLYANYGAWLIKQYPIEFAKYYLIPNFMNYYTPSPEFLGIYNMGADSIDVEAKEWFHYKTRKVRGYSKDKDIVVTKSFPVILALINVLFFASYIGFVFLGGYKHINAISRKILVLLMIVWCSNLAFSVTASPIVLRYQVFPFVFMLPIGVILLAYLIKESLNDSVKDSTVVQNEVSSLYST